MTLLEKDGFFSIVNFYLRFIFWKTPGAHMLKALEPMWNG